LIKFLLIDAKKIGFKDFSKSTDKIYYVTCVSLYICIFFLYIDNSSKN